jgi:hypothetical protein
VITKRLDRTDFLAAVLILVFVPAIFYPLLSHMTSGSATLVPATDFCAHNAWVARMRAEHKLLLPHPLYHLSVIAVQKLEERMTHDTSRPSGKEALDNFETYKNYLVFAAVNTKYARAAIIAVLLYQLVLAWTLWRLLKYAGGPGASPGVFAAVALAIALMLLMPVALLAFQDQRLYYGYVAPDVWHSPTVIVARPLALLTFIVAIQSVLESKANWRPWLLIPVAIVVTVLGGLAKPSFLLCLVPALGIVVAVQWLRGRPAQWPLYVFGLAVPAAALIGWQYYALRFISDGGVEWAPLKAMSALSDFLLPKFLLSIVFPVVAYAAFFNEARQRVSLNVAWLTFALAAVLTYCLAEKSRASTANFTWSGQLALFVLFVETALFVLATARGRLAGAASRSSLLLRASACLVAFSLHVAFGLLYYTHLLMTPSTAGDLYR